MSTQFGQFTSLVSDLRGIIREYGGSQILREFLQNADDAGAKQFKVLLDTRQRGYGTRSLLQPSLVEFQGASLYCYDDVEFKEQDYVSIQRVGDGLKRGDPTKTGQFGLGFNSCYHLTDLPCFISGKNLVMFDPHRRHLPSMVAGGEPSTGRVFDLSKPLDERGNASNNNEDLCFAERFPDQIAPFVGIFGCDGRGSWDDTIEGNSKNDTSGHGTLFRLPLRTKSIAKASMIKRSGSAIDAHSIYDDVVVPFMNEANSCLLFLRHVENIEVYLLTDAANSTADMKRIYKASIDDMNTEKRMLRQSQLCMLKHFMSLAETQMTANNYDQSDIEAENKTMTYKIALELMMETFEYNNNIPRPIICFSVKSIFIELALAASFSKSGQARALFTNNDRKGPITSIDLLYTNRMEQYVVSFGFGDRSDVQYIIDVLQSHPTMALVPYAAIAARLAVFEGRDVEMSAQLEGKVFCCLPTPITSGLPVHIDGRWELTRDRNNLSGSSNTTGDKSDTGKDGSDRSEEYIRGEWNERLACRVAATAYARLLQVLPLQTVGSMLHPVVAPHITCRHYYDLFPINPQYVAPWNTLVMAMYVMLCDGHNEAWAAFQYQQAGTSTARKKDEGRSLFNSLGLSSSKGNPRNFAITYTALPLPSSNRDGNGVPFLRVLREHHLRGTSLTLVEHLYENEFSTPGATLFWKQPNNALLRKNNIGNNNGKGDGGGKVVAANALNTKQPLPPVPPRKKTSFFQRGLKALGMGGEDMNREDTPAAAQSDGITEGEVPGMAGNSVSTSILKVLIDSQVFITDCPMQILEAFELYCVEPPAGLLSPMAVRNLLKAGTISVHHNSTALVHPHHEQYNNKNGDSTMLMHYPLMMELLEYCLSDILTSNDNGKTKSGYNASELLGIPLLPVLSAQAYMTYNLAQQYPSITEDLATSKTNATKRYETRVASTALEVCGLMTIAPAQQYHQTSHPCIVSNDIQSSEKGPILDLHMVANESAISPFTSLLFHKNPNLANKQKESMAVFMVPYEASCALQPYLGDLKLRCFSLDTLVHSLSSILPISWQDSKRESNGYKVQVWFVLDKQVHDGPLIDSSDESEMQILGSWSSSPGRGDSGRCRSGHLKSTINALRESESNNRHTNLHIVNLTFLKYLWYIICTEIEDNNSNTNNAIRGDVNIPACLAVLEQWCLLPVVCDEMYYLMPLKNASCALLPPSTNSSSNSNIEEVLQEAGVASILDHFLDDTSTNGDGNNVFSSVALGHMDERYRLRQVRPKDVLQLLTTADTMIVEHFSATNKQVLLEYFAMHCGDFDSSDDLNRIAAMPLFIREGQGDSTGVCAYARLNAQSANSNKEAKPAEGWYTLPEFDETGSVVFTEGINLEMSRFLKTPSDTCRVLYNSLGVQPLPRHDFYLLYVLPDRIWRQLHEGERMKLLKDIKTNYEGMRNKRVASGDTKNKNKDASTFDELFRSLPVFNTVDGHWLSVSSLVDPRVDLLRSFFPHRLPAENLWASTSRHNTNRGDRNMRHSIDDNDAWLVWLSSIGMSSYVSRALLFECGQQVDLQYQEWEAQYVSLDSNKKQSSSRSNNGKADTNYDRLENELVELKNASRQIVTYLFENYYALQNNSDSHSNNNNTSHSNSSSLLEGISSMDPIVEPTGDFKEWLQAFGRLHLAHIWQEPPSNVRHLISLRSTIGGMVPFANSVAPVSGLTAAYATCWSVAHVVRTFNLSTAGIRSCIKGLGAREEPTLMECLMHLEFVTQLDKHILMSWDEEEKNKSSSLSSSMYYSSNSSSSMQATNTFGGQLSWLYREIAFQAARGGNSGTIIQETLQGKAWVLLIRYEDREVSTTTRLNARVAVQVPEFVRADQVFSILDSNDDEDMPPYAYSLKSCHTTLRSGERELALLDLLGAKNTPSIQQIQEWSRMMFMKQQQSQESRGKGAMSVGLSESDLRVALKLATAAAKVSREGNNNTAASASALQQMYIPDSSNVLRMAGRALFLDDAPWLAQRINKSLIPTVHQGIGHELASKIGVRKLSMNISEVPSMTQQNARLLSKPLPPLLNQAVQSWQEKISSGMFQGAIRRAISGSNNNNSNNNEQPHTRPHPRGGHGGRGGQGMRMDTAHNEFISAETLTLRIGLLANAVFKPSEDVKSRFLVNMENREVDVTANAEGSLAILVMESADNRKKDKGGNRQYNDSLTLDGALVPVVYLLVEYDQGHGGNQALRKGWRRRLLAAISIQLNKYLGFALSDKGLVSELLSVDDIEEFSDVLDSWHIPTSNVDLSIGSVTNYTTADLVMVDIRGSDFATGKTVYFHQHNLNTSSSGDGNGDGGGVLLKGKIEAILQNGNSCLVCVTPEGITQTFDSTLLYTQPQKQANAVNIEGTSSTVGGNMNRAEDNRKADDRDDDGSVPTGGDNRHRIPPAVPSEKGKEVEWTCTVCTFINPPLAPVCSMCNAVKPEGGDSNGMKHDSDNYSSNNNDGMKMGGTGLSMDDANVELYKPVDPRWEEIETKVLESMRESAFIKESLPMEEEALGVDQFHLAAPTQEALALLRERQEQGEASDVMMLDMLRKTDMDQAVQTNTKIQKRRGYDLLRVGNYHEEDNHPLPDIAFFHHRLTMHLVPSRQKLVQVVCKVLREVSHQVFDYDARLVTLFYEEGAPSRFIKQKLMFNIAPVDKFRRENTSLDLGDCMSLTQYPFLYTYIYGLFLHKLAHFFDVVHGSRHNFFMSEYRALYIIKWLDLLQSKGFDPEQVEQVDYAKPHLYSVVF